MMKKSWKQLSGLNNIKRLSLPSKPMANEGLGIGIPEPKTKIIDVSSSRVVTSPHPGKGGQSQ